jgi:hypothetical protein
VRRIPNTVSTCHHDCGKSCSMKEATKGAGCTCTMPAGRLSDHLNPSNQINSGHAADHRADNTVAMVCPRRLKTGSTQASLLRPSHSKLACLSSLLPELCHVRAALPYSHILLDGYCDMVKLADKKIMCSCWLPRPCLQCFCKVSFGGETLLLPVRSH